MIDELEQLKRERPEVPAPSPEVRASARRALETAIENHRSHSRARPSPVRLSRLLPAAAVLVVVAVVAVFLGIQGRKPSAAPAGPTASGGPELVYVGEPTAQAPVVTHAAIARTVLMMRRRIAALGGPVGNGIVSVSSAGDRIFVHVAREARLPGMLQLLPRLGTSPRLEFYDWEANVLTPTGQTVASLLPAQNPNALEISGQGSNAAGSPGAGSMALYQAVELAAKQPYEASRANSRLGSEYFAFGAPESAECRLAASYYRVAEFGGLPCYLAGPDDSLSELTADLPRGVTPSRAEVLIVKQGTVVLQAAPSSYTNPPAWSDPSAQYYVLRDRVALFGNQLTNPQQSRDVSGAPDVTFGFTSRGSAEFQSLTAQIAQRGALIGGFGRQLYQHFAVALDTRLIALPYIDYKTYPDGISGRAGAVIPAPTVAAARALAAQLRLGAFPIDLKLIQDSLPGCRSGVGRPRC